jgi:serine/threonine protein phosphatase PrpC
VKERFIAELTKLASFKNRQYSVALREAFIKIDEIMLSPQGNEDLKKYKETGKEDTNAMFGRPESDNIGTYTGCTACTAIITDTEIICANSGDSRCVLSVDGKALDMSIDHKPDNIGERTRIERAGGFVEESRVKGVLALSRALGDFEYKKNKFVGIEEQMVTCIPEIKIEKLTKKTDFVIIACDGIWDCLTSQECITMCKELMARRKLSDCVGQIFENIVASDVASSGKFSAR